MRIWSLHPKYLDSKGLVALWRESLLAQKVLQGKTKGYKKHSQLIRFKSTKNPLGAIAIYLRHIALEADKRGYVFDKNKILRNRIHEQILVNDGQIKYEWQHLLKKLKERDTVKYQYLKTESVIKTHPLFVIHSGDVEEWENIK